MVMAMATAMAPATAMPNVIVMGSAMALAMATGTGSGDGEFGWEFQFLVPISGTPIGSRIPILFSIPKIPVGIFFMNSAVEKLRNRNSDSKIWNSEKKSCRN